MCECSSPFAVEKIEVVCEIESRFKDKVNALLADGWHLHGTATTVFVPLYEEFLLTQVLVRYKTSMMTARPR